MSDAWLALVSATAGAVVGGGASILASYLTTRAQSTAAKDDWKRRRQDVRDGAQRELIFQMQDTMAAYARLTARIMIEDTRNARGGGEYGAALVDEELSESARETGARFQVLVSRLLDRELRELAEAFAAKTSEVTIAGSRAAAEAHFRDLVTLSRAVNTRVTALLQTL
jgi:hypothetical protein